MKKYGAIIILGVFVVGFIMGLNQDYSFENVVGISFSFKYLFLLLGIISLSLIVSYIGIPMFLIYLIIDIFLSGLITAFFFNTDLLLGIIFSMLYIIIFKISYWFFLLLNGFYSLKLIKNNYIYLFYRYRANKNNSKLYLKKMLIINSVIIIFVFLTVTLGNHIIIPLSNYLLF